MNKKVKGAIIAVAVVMASIWIITKLPNPTSDQPTSDSDVMLMHIHPRLYLNVDGKPFMVPQNVGIDPIYWKDHSLDQYGMKGMAPIHTHTADGILHVESKVVRNYTLEEFLDIWGLDLTEPPHRQSHQLCNFISRENL